MSDEVRADIAAHSRQTGLLNEWEREYKTRRAATDPETDCFGPIVSLAKPLRFTVGTGYDIISDVCSRIQEETQHELLFVTCFWTTSESRTRVASLLRSLSEKAVSSESGKKIAVRLCFSSRSVFQKLFQSSSPRGYTYKPSEWQKTLGLPPPSSLPGLDMQIKSIYVRPFSVMHPKFIVVDRRTVFLPSCNVSWESWFEGCITMQGSIARDFVNFYQGFWAIGDKPLSQPQSLLQTTGTHEHLDGTPHVTVEDLLAEVDHASPLAADGFSSGDSTFALRAATQSHSKSHDEQRSIDLAATGSLPLTIPTPQRAATVRAALLPHAHRANPRFRPFPCQSAPTPAPTPLNTFLLHAFEHAQRSIFIQTPNLTSPPVLSALLDAAERGVDVLVITNERLMTLEQLVTAGTTTPRCVSKLLREFERRKRGPRWMRNRQDADVGSVENDVEATGAQDADSGSIRVDYFADLQKRKFPEQKDRPDKSHLKLTIIDDQVVVLGSGNMDRASWYTSQELGVAFISTPLAKTITQLLKPAVGYT